MTIDVQQLLIALTAYIVAAASPGPSNMRIMGVAMHQGRASALALSAGVISGSFFWGAMAATGLSAILARYAEILTILKILGGLYLLYLAFNATRAALRSGSNTAMPIQPKTRANDYGAHYRRGLFLHLANPKAILGWISLMTLGLGANASTQQLTAVLIGCAMLSITIFTGYAIIFSTAPMVRLYHRAHRWIEGTLAACFGAAGLHLLLSRS